MSNDFSIKFPQLLREQIDISKRFLELLLQERQAIAGGQLDEFNRINQEKMPLIENLARLDIEIFSALREVCNEQESHNVEFFLKNISEDILRLWKKVSEIARRCQGENSLNARIVEACKTQNERSLDILLGRTSSVELYGATGKRIKDRNGAYIKA